MRSFFALSLFLIILSVTPAKCQKNLKLGWSLGSTIGSSLESCSTQSVTIQASDPTQAGVPPYYMISED
ncbi:hypothetical protein WG66_008324 [Moniliophthora roreri]|nr:hypothetical protein WG66_008324 [Moniliophthora roreri]